MLLPSPVQILCFGNSLTQGFPINHPYAIALEETFQISSPYISISTDVQGLPGDQVVSPPGHYLPRLDILYNDIEIPYNWMVILGGTNDLNQNQNADDIFEYLMRAWEYALSRGTQVLALTVPECGACSPELNPRRDYLNGMIRAHRAENFHVLDLHDAIPYWSMSEEERKRIWIDGVHFTEEGYDRMGALIGGELHRLMSGGQLRNEQEHGQKALMFQRK
ncbi:hypothetical protein MFRU_001g02720 [Monilinia fructicola]|uniref:SGNH hydrolase-type esterase domain-containing protein n=1 Tax=Monilinia fructicola TaxID=38448 RepID=A0A5M9JYT9_MONFR|nr:hypothetical protein EYC84_005381 [Monilinia fructicola]KAG4035503.1 hypothetical protein MFRU_001g02720 [Monilinia fructicola]